MKNRASSYHILYGMGVFFYIPPSFHLQRLPLGCSPKWTVPLALVFSTCLTSHWWVFGKPTKTDARFVWTWWKYSPDSMRCQPILLYSKCITSQEFTFLLPYTVYLQSYYRYCFSASKWNGVFSTKRVALL